MEERPHSLFENNLNGLAFAIWNKMTEMMSEQLCRLCLSINDGNHLNIFSVFDNEMKMCDILSEHFKSEVSNWIPNLIQIKMYPFKFLYIDQWNRFNAQICVQIMLVYNRNLSRAVS